MKDTQFDQEWEQIYSRGEQLNLYPYDSIVSFLMRRFKKDLSRKKIKLLEIGCGAGNNLWFAAREGFDVTGIDASESAIKFAADRFKKEGLDGRFSVGNFANLPYDEGEFDVVIDRASMTHVGYSIARQVVLQIQKVLKHDGLFYSEVFSDHASSLGKPVEDGLLDISQGPYAKAGAVFLYGRNELCAMYKSGWSILELIHSEEKHYLNDRASAEIFASWSILVKKK